MLLPLLDWLNCSISSWLRVSVRLFYCWIVMVRWVEETLLVAAGLEIFSEPSEEDVLVLKVVTLWLSPA